MQSTKRSVLTAAGLAALAVIASGANLASAGAREQARRIHDRIAGVPPSAAVLDQMESEVAAGRPEEAARIAMENSAFYTVTLKNFVTPWTNRDQTVFAPLNDYTATVIGMVRDDVPFNTLLSADILYIGANGLGLPAYSQVNNDHYEQLESRGIDLKANLVQASQSSLLGIPAAATAGVMTSRAASEAFFIDGTNRAMFRFTMMNHLCHDLEEVQDTSRPPDRIRQDVSRSPGGDSRIFLNSCIGCHSGMDPLAQSLAYYDFDETQNRLVYTAGQVQAKYFNNQDNFKPGFATPDDSWENYWRKGPNRKLGWDSSKPGFGSGAKTMGEELAASDAFASCQVEKVFKTVCFRAPNDAADRARAQQITSDFKSGGYKLKDVFAETAAYCMGD
ncbi:MAG: hypothetical protein R3E77_12040 [Steroidobacteraceae bacterium]